MSGIRRAMLEMGLATCCLMCDAPDVAGSARCKGCISNHRTMREKVQSLPNESLAYQWAMEMLQMLARPGSFEHDETHGEWMTVYASLLRGSKGSAKKVTQEDVEAAFATARKKRKRNPLRDIANQNKWKDGKPSEEEINRLSQDLPEDVVDASGIRTVPSKDIAKIDMSDRLGEDPELVARVQANAALTEESDDERDLMADIEVSEKMMERKKWDDIVEGIDDLLD